MLEDEGCIVVAIVVVEVRTEKVACGDDENVTVCGDSEYLAFTNTEL